MINKTVKVMSGVYIGLTIEYFTPGEKKKEKKTNTQKTQTDGGFKQTNKQRLVSALNPIKHKGLS